MTGDEKTVLDGILDYWAAIGAAVAFIVGYSELRVRVTRNSKDISEIKRDQREDFKAIDGKLDRLTDHIIELKGGPK